MTDRRKDLAEELCSGLAGWLQLQAAQRLAHLPGEDSARMTLAQILAAHGTYRADVAQLPANWGSTKKRVDVALRGRRQNATGWYGAIELKWPGDAIDVAQTREQILQDAVRVASIETSNLNAHLVILGGSSGVINQLFDKVHPNAVDQENRRQQFTTLLGRASTKSHSSADSKLRKLFPALWDRVPSTVAAIPRGKLEVKLLASAEATVADRVVGKVFVWQCNWARGRRMK